MVPPVFYHSYGDGRTKGFTHVGNTEDIRSKSAHLDSLRGGYVKCDNIIRRQLLRDQADPYSGSVTDQPEFYIISEFNRPNWTDCEVFQDEVIRSLLPLALKGEMADDAFYQESPILLLVDDSESPPWIEDMGTLKTPDPRTEQMLAKYALEVCWGPGYPIYVLRNTPRWSSCQSFLDQVTESRKLSEKV